MEREEWSALVVLVTRLLPATCGPRFTFNWRAIVITYLWAVLHNQPVSWAYRPQHWPADLCAMRLPTPATMSRRLRSPGATVPTVADSLRIRVRREFMGRISTCSFLAATVRPSNRAGCRKAG